LMPVPDRSDSDTNWLLYKQAPNSLVTDATHFVDLAQCSLVDQAGMLLSADAVVPRLVPHIHIVVHWKGNTAEFPVRFDDKATLPMLLFGRRATEGELIEYFLLGKEPSDDGPGNGPTETSGNTPPTEAGVDTRRILSYFIRRFVMAIPGIEAELARAAYSNAALDAALRGPTSPLELAERAFSSLDRTSTADEPCKTPIAVGFQLVEVCAALARSRERIPDPALRSRFDPVLDRCQQLLKALAVSHPELADGTFRKYRKHFAGGAW